MYPALHQLRALSDLGRHAKFSPCVGECNSRGLFNHSRNATLARYRTISPNQHRCLAAQPNATSKALTSSPGKEAAARAACLWTASMSTFDGIVSEFPDIRGSSPHYPLLALPMSTSPSFDIHQVHETQSTFSATIPRALRPWPASSVMSTATISPGSRPSSRRCEHLTLLDPRPSLN